ncbi:YtoQ family protein [Oceanimonas sp. NS1]|nr:YtoQ family protein [Oceanimonas sp. NS1]
MSDKIWNVYLSGEIHTDWREQIIAGCEAKGLKVRFSSAVTDHDASDMVGVNILGSEEDNFWRDRKASGINSIRTSTHIREADLVVVRSAPNTSNGMPPLTPALPWHPVCPSSPCTTPSTITR